MKDIKAGEVKQLQIRLETAKKLHAKLEQEIAEFKQKNEHLKQQFTIKITSEIAEAQAKMAVLKLDFMSIEEAHTRYKQLEAKLETGNVTKAVSLFDGK